MSGQVDFGTIQLPTDPVDGVLRWLADAAGAGAPEPTAMTLATADKSGRPSARIVLHKGVSAGVAGCRGFTFYTHYESRKSGEMIANPFASLVFYWPVLNRQIRIEGRIEKVAAEESDQYFQSRPRGSRIGAWASPQSKKIASRDALLQRVKEIEEKFNGPEVPRPEFWGGWRLVPERIEFWQAGDSRLHDRFAYEWDGKSSWTVSRLAP
jgi:pyridoxamine 5'-phosphate oxidase